jgi:tetratricopeptide (TPR) repeat protein
MRAAALLLALLLLPAGTAHAHDETTAELARLDSLAHARPDDLAPRLRHAELSRLVGDPASARRDLDRVEARAPRHPGALLLEGALALDARRPADAVRWISRFLEVSDGVSDGTVAGALALRAGAHAALGDTLRALADYDRAFATVPRADWALARARLAGGGARALDGLDHALLRLPDEPSLVFLAADLDAALGRVDAGVERLARLADRAARREAILARAGDLYAAAGRRLEAEAEWSKALRLLSQDRRGMASRSAQDLKRQLEAALSAGAP